jgi:hypothetical protein
MTKQNDIEVVALPPEAYSRINGQQVLELILQVDVMFINRFIGSVYISILPYQLFVPM